VLKAALVAQQDGMTQRVRVNKLTRLSLVIACKFDLVNVTVLSRQVLLAGPHECSIAEICFTKTSMKQGAPVTTGIFGEWPILSASYLSKLLSKPI
jgi:hypothetical protein